MNERRKTILVFLKYYLPGYKAGGPLRSVSNLVDWCGDSYNFKIVTGDRDAREQQSYDHIKLNEWNTVGKAEVLYLEKKHVNPFYLTKILNKTAYDFIYFNSFFRFKFSIIPLFLLKFIFRADLSKVLLAPRGEFNSGALEIKSFKKKLFIRFIKHLGIYNRINWQATNETERTNIKKTMDIESGKIFLAPNLPQKNNDKQVPGTKKRINNLRIVYLSRITPIKNLLFALDVIQQAKDINIEFDLYGLMDDVSYWKSCKRVIDSMNGKAKVTYRGMISHDEVLQTLTDYDLFFLPTSGENFGHAIYESFLAGTPVLISDQTPWQNLIEKGLGWDIPLDNQEAFVEVIKKMGALNASEMTKMKEDVKDAINRMDIHKNVEQNKSMLNAVVY